MAQMQGTVNGQAGAELRALLHQRLVMIEGSTGPSSDGPRPRMAEGVEAISPPPFKVPVPRMSTSVGRSVSVPQDNHAHVREHAQAVPQRGGHSNMAPAVAHRQPGATGAPPPPCAPRAQSCLSSPKGSQLLEANAVAVHKLQNDYHVTSPKSPIQADRSDAWTMKGQVEVPVERFLSTNGMMVRGSGQQIHRSNTSEVDTASVVMRKVSCGRLYEELAFLRKENSLLRRTCMELEQRANDDFGQQLADELAQLRQDNQVLQSDNHKLHGRISELDESEQESHDALIGTTALKLEELRQKQEAEAERNRDQLDLLLIKNEQLNREINDLRRARCEQADQANPQFQVAKKQKEWLTQEVTELRRALHDRLPKCELDELRKQMEDRNLELEGELAEQKSVHLEAFAQLQELREERVELQQTYVHLEQRAGLESSEHLARVQLQREEHRSLTGTIESLYVELHSAKGRPEMLEEENQQLTSEFELLQLDMQAATVRFHSEMDEQRCFMGPIQEENLRLAAEVKRLQAEREATEARLQGEVDEQRCAARSAEEEKQELMNEIAMLRLELHTLRERAPGASEDASPCWPEASPCSQNRLKAVMNDRSATLEQLREAIGAAEAFVGEARREFAAKQLREKRACYERLHSAIEKEEVDLLAEAIADARRAEVDEEDIGKGEAKLALLRSLSDQQRAAKALHALSMENKKQAFHHVKKDDVDALRSLLEGLDQGVRWQDWRDFMGRTLRRYALDLRAGRVQAYLQALSEAQAAQESVSEQGPADKPHHGADKTDSDTTLYVLTARSAAAPAAEAVRPAGETEEIVKEAEPPVAAPAVVVEAEPPAEGATTARNADPEAEPPADPLEAAQVLSEAEVAAFKQKAFRSVVQDNTSVLADLLQRLPMDIWSKWENKAGKDLLTLSQERGSSGAYSVLAKALGLVQEQKRDSFDEREAVWIFAHGEVQPWRATVLEDTAEEADEILIEYWDGDAPPCHVERCLVRKMWS